MVDMTTKMKMQDAMNKLSDDRVTAYTWIKKAEDCGNEPAAKYWVKMFDQYRHKWDGAVELLEALGLKAEYVVEAGICHYIVKEAQ